MGMIETLKKGLNKIFKSGDEDKMAASIYEVFEEYKSAYASELRRLSDCEKYYLGRHWELHPPADDKEPRPTTPIIQATIENITADLMDNFPEAMIMPEGPEDDLVAMILQEIIAQNHDAAGYIQEYRKLSHDLLVGGYMVQEVGYDPLLNNGLGGAYIRQVDNQSILLDPLCADAQDSRAIIKYEGLPRDVLYERYPHIKFTGDHYTVEGSTIQHDPNITKDTAKMVLLLEYWWREYDEETGYYSVHMCKAAGGKIVEDSRKEKPEGYYAHGQYPFIITPLFLRKGSSLGWGLVDMFENRQMTADKLDQIVLKNALMASHNKLLVAAASGFDVDDLRDWSKEVHEGESLNGITWYPTPPLPEYIFSYIQNIRQSIKDESGANDISRGNVGGGVTAASAIAALQEMSGKRSRMAARQMHEAYKAAVRLEIEVEREFNLLPREVVVTYEGEKRKETFDNALLMRETQLGNRVPVEFAVSIKVQKENRWSQMAHNELVLQMVQLQVIKPEQAVELMQFEGKALILEQNRQAQQEGQADAAQQQAQQAMQQQLQGMPPPEQALEEEGMGAQMPPEMMQGMPPEMMQGMPPDMMQGQVPPELQGMPPEMMQGLPPELQGLPPELMGKLPPELRR